MTFLKTFVCSFPGFFLVVLLGKISGKCYLFSFNLFIFFFYQRHKEVVCDLHCKNQPNRHLTSYFGCDKMDHASWCLTGDGLHAHAHVASHPGSIQGVACYKLLIIYRTLRS